MWLPHPESPKRSSAPTPIAKRTNTDATTVVMILSCGFRSRNLATTASVNPMTHKLEISAKRVARKTVLFAGQYPDAKASATAACTWSITNQKSLCEVHQEKSKSNKRTLKSETTDRATAPTDAATRTVLWRRRTASTRSPIAATDDAARTDQAIAASSAFEPRQCNNL